MCPGVKVKAVKSLTTGHYSSGKAFKPTPPVYGWE